MDFDAPRRRGPWTATLAVVAVATVTAAAIGFSGGGDAFWVCVPAALLVSASSESVAGAALATAVVVGAGAVPELASDSLGPLPSTPLWLCVPAVSVAVLLVARRRVVRERDALRASALTDALTGAANRRSLLVRIDYEIARHRRAGGRFTLLMLDLDGFKLLNDRFGHPAGDDLLVELVSALRRAVREQDTVARIGGDEFCVLAPETDRSGAQRLTARVLRAVGEVTAGLETLGAGAGTAVFPEDGVTVAALLKAADERLLGAKRQTRAAPAHRAA